jgi:hypothetical protein
LSLADFRLIWKTRRALHVVGRVEPESPDAPAGLALADGRFGAQALHALGDGPSLVVFDVTGRPRRFGP